MQFDPVKCTVAGYPVSCKFDNFQFDKEPHEQNDTQTSTVSAAYVPAMNRVGLSWNAKQED